MSEGNFTLKSFPPVTSLTPPMKGSCETVNSLLAHSWKCYWLGSLVLVRRYPAVTNLGICSLEGFSKTHIYTPIVSHSIECYMHFCQVLHILSYYSISCSMLGFFFFETWLPQILFGIKWERMWTFIQLLTHPFTHTFNKSYWMNACYMPDKMSTLEGWKRIRHCPFPQGVYYLMWV